jgi:hypothetical protein
MNQLPDTTRIMTVFSGKIADHYLFDYVLFLSSRRQEGSSDETKYANLSEDPS